MSAPAPAPAVEDVARVARELERHCAWPGAFAGCELRIDAWLRLPRDGVGVRFELAAPLPVRHALNGCFHLRLGESDGRHEIALEGVGAALMPFPRDEALPGLHAAVHAGGQPLSWRPGRRAVVRARAAEPTPYWKFVDRKAFARVQALLARPGMEPLFASGLVRPVAIREEWSAVAWAQARGTSLHDLAAAGAPIDVVRVAAAVRALRESGRDLLSSGALPPFAAEAEIETLERARQFAARVRPEVALAVAARARRLEPPAGDAAPALLHRDLHDKQLFFRDDGGDGAGCDWIDVDTLAAGPHELDETNLAAHLWLRAEQGSAPAGRGHARALLAAFGHDPDRLAGAARFFLATSLLRLACVYAVRPRWRRVPDGLLAAADSVVTRGSLP